MKTTLQPKKPFPTTQKYTCVDLFAGAGGFSLAAINANMYVAAALEYDKAASNTYKKNIPKAQDHPLDFYEGDILNIDPSSLIDNEFLATQGCDLILGGPPCQGFSVHRIKNAGVDDERNKLILRYFEYVSRLRPKFFLMENVPGILWPRHKHYIEEFYSEGNKAGYDIFPPATLDARDYGIPQRRKRVFILGVRKDVKEKKEINITWPPSKTHGDDKDCRENLDLLPWTTARHIFIKPLDDNDENNVHMNHNPALVEVFKSTPPNGGSRHESNRILPCHKNHNGHSDVYGRIDPAQPGPTMTTACINPSKGRFLHPTKHHGITVREAARFQTFPDWYTFSGGIMAAAKQVGNAVPVDFGEVLIRGIKYALDKYYATNQK